MKTAKLFLFSLLCTFTGTMNVMSQELILEKNYPISREADNGYLGGIETKDNGKFDLIYFLPGKKNKVRTQTYSFDADCNLLGKSDNEWEIEQAQKNYKGFTYKGDEVLGQNIAVSAGLTGKMTYKKRQYTKKWDWWAGRYKTKVKLLESQKLNNAEGEQYRFSGAYAVQSDNSILALAYDPGKGNIKGEGNYDLIKVDNEGNVQVLQNVKFPNYMTLLYSRPLQDNLSGDISNEEMPRDWVLVLAPNKDNTEQLQYLRISPDGKIKENFSFASPASGYRILNAYDNGDAVYLYGPAIKKNGKSAFSLLGSTVPMTSMSDEELSLSQTDMNSNILGGVNKIAGILSGKEEMTSSQSQIDDLLDAKKYTDFILAKVKNGAMEMITETPMKELNDKAVAGPDMKKPLSFDGKKFITDNFQVLSNGMMMLALQDYKDTKAGGGGLGGNKLLGAMTGISTSTSGPAYTKVYQGMYLLQFSPSGNLVRNYTVNLDQKNKKGFLNNSPMTADNFPASSYVYESKDGKTIKWVMDMVKAIDKETDHYSTATSNVTSTSYMPFYSIQYGQINLENGNSTEFKTLGQDEKNKFYLYDRYDRVRIGNYVYFFSETPKGDKLLVSRITL